MRLWVLFLVVTGLLAGVGCDNSDVSPQEAAYMLTGKCFPACDGKECGDDRCGGQCGSCFGSQTCNGEGLCEYKTVHVGDEDTYSRSEDTWTDPSSSLTWQVTPTGGTMSWEQAKSHCSGLELDGGGWRLPTIGELRTLIRGCPATEHGGSCNVEEGKCLSWSCRDGSCAGCSANDGPAEGGMYWPDIIMGECCWYWSSSPVEDNADSAWLVTFDLGYVYSVGVDDDKLARCVR